MVFLALAGSSLPVAASWAVAIAPGGQPIVARDYDSTIYAKPAALADCEKLSGRPCTIVASSFHDCAAMATTGKTWGIGQGKKLPEAREAALLQCKANKAGTCKVVHEFCGR
jgi:hypothetical protein